MHRENGEREREREREDREERENERETGESGVERSAARRAVGVSGLLITAESGPFEGEECDWRMQCGRRRHLGSTRGRRVRLPAGFHSEARKLSLCRTGRLPLKPMHHRLA